MLIDCPITIKIVIQSTEVGRDCDFTDVIRHEHMLISPCYTVNTFNPFASHFPLIIDAQSLHSPPNLQPCLTPKVSHQLPPRATLTQTKLPMPWTTSEKLRRLRQRVTSPIPSPGLSMPFPLEMPRRPPQQPNKATTSRTLSLAPVAVSSQ